MGSSGHQSESSTTDSDFNVSDDESSNLHFLRSEEMTAATVASVAERRAMLRALGARPGREAVEQAQQALSKIDAQLEEQLDNLYYAGAPAGMNAAHWTNSQELELREMAEKEKIPYKSVIQLDELHQSYEDILEQEERALDGRDYQLGGALCYADDGTHAEAARLLQDAYENRRETLNLSNSFMSHVPEFFGRIVTLVSLDLSNNQLQLLPDSVAGLVNLELLKVHSNQLKNLPDSIGLLTKLKYLDVSSNALKNLPESLGRCSSLQEINANFNQLEFISSNFGFLLVNLRKLELHLNKLSCLPSSICELKSLKYLDLHMNKLKSLPSSIGNLSQLEYLDVSSNFNDLLALPESIGDLISLTYCDLSFNQIRELPDSMGRLESLGTLKLDGNPLCIPPMEVVEHSHEAVMQYLQQRWKSSVEGDELVSGEANAYSPRGQMDYIPWVSSWAGGSYLGTLIGSLCGSVGTVFGGKTGNFLGFQEHQRDNFLEQQL